MANTIKKDKSHFFSTLTGIVFLVYALAQLLNFLIRTSLSIKQTSFGSDSISPIFVIYTTISVAVAATIGLSLLFKRNTPMLTIPMALFSTPFFLIAANFLCAIFSNSVIAALIIFICSLGSILTFVAIVFLFTFLLRKKDPRAPRIILASILGGMFLLTSIYTVVNFINDLSIIEYLLNILEMVGDNYGFVSYSLYLHLSPVILLPISAFPFIGTLLSAFGIKRDNISATTIEKSIAEKPVEKIEQKEENSPKEINTNLSGAPDEILQYKKLLDMGVITQEEFDKKKKQLMGI